MPAPGETTSAELAERARIYAERATEDLDIGEVTTHDMQAIARSLAHAFVIGYAAALDDARPVSALGGAGERRARAARAAGKARR